MLLARPRGWPDHETSFASGAFVGLASKVDLALTVTGAIATDRLSSIRMADEVDGTLEATFGYMYLEAKLDSSSWGLLSRRALHTPCISR